MNGDIKMQDENSTKNLVSRTAFEFVIVTIVLCIIGVFAHHGIQSRINSTLEHSIYRHISTISYSIERTFNERFKILHVVSSWIEKRTIALEEVFRTYELGDGKLVAGIMRRNENTQNFSEVELKELSRAFEGEDVVFYSRANGLTFAVPVKFDGEDCIYYEQIDNNAIPDLIGIDSYDGEGRVTIGYKTGEWTEISLGENAGKFYNELYIAPGFREAYSKTINIDSLENGIAVKSFEFNDESYIAFASYVCNQDFAIFGLVKRDAVSAGIDYVHMVMLGAIGLLILFILLFARYLYKEVENKELEREKSLALQASKTKSDFLSSMSHEIRTPINAIMGMNEMVIRESTNKDILEYSENLQNAAKTLLSLVNDILDFSKIEAGKMEIIPVEYHLSSLLNDLVNMINTRVEKKGLTFKINADRTLPSILFGDEIRIKQIITNILTNAVKYTEKGSVTLIVKSKLIDEEKFLLCVSVSDTGIGIKQEDISKLFSAFERIEEERNRNVEGTGLGMSITQKLLKMMNSKLNVESVYGQGSTFSFEIEQKIINSEPLGDFQENYRQSLTNRNEYHEKFTAPNAEILVVDDTKMNLTVVKGLLKQTKIKIDTVGSGKECLQMVRNKHYDIIFLDHKMPEMDGIETLQAMKEMTDNINSATPVISLTANAISGAREQYISAGFQDYLTKPINSEKLENLIIKYLPKDKVIISDSDKKSAIVSDSADLPEWLMKVEGLNIKAGIEHCGDVDSYLEVLKVYANSVVNAADEIENFYKNEDWKNYTTKVHALKSSSRVIGADELSEKAKLLEDAGNLNHIEKIKNNTQPLLDLYRSYAEKLAPFIETEEDNSNKPLIDDGALAEAFETMKDAAATFDYDSLNFVFQSLDEYKLPDDEIERYKQIKEAAAKLDWEKVNELLKHEI